MSTYLSRAEAVIGHLNEFLQQFRDLIAEQAGLASAASNAAPADLLAQMRFAQNILERRQRNLKDSLGQAEMPRFVHELWSLGGDIPHLDFDLSHLADSGVFGQRGGALSKEALILTRDLKSAAAQTILAAEIAAADRPPSA